MIAVPCILPTQVCNGIYQTKDKTSRLSVPIVERIKFREISYKCTTDRFERVLKSFTMFARGDCSSHGALHQRSCNLNILLGDVSILLVARQLTSLYLMSYHTETSLSPHTAKLFPGDSWSPVSSQADCSFRLASVQAVTWRLRSSLAFDNWNILRFIGYIHVNTHFPSSLNAVLWKVHALILWTAFISFVFSGVAEAVILWYTHGWYCWLF